MNRRADMWGGESYPAFEGRLDGTFARITVGPANAGGVDTNKQALLLDRQNGIVEVVPDSGNMQGLQTAINLATAQTALTTITTAQNLLAILLNAGVLNKKNRTLLITAYCIFTSTGTPTITIALTLAGVTICTITTAALGANVTNGQLVATFILTVVTTGSAATLEVHGSVSQQATAANGTAVPQYLDQNTAVSSAVNLTIADQLNLTIAANATVASAQLRLATVELVN